MVLGNHLLGILAPVIIRHMTKEIPLKQGRVRGLLIELPATGRRKMTPTEAFYGLSYATLRTGQLRFQRPTNPHEKWRETKFLNETKSPCSQRRLNLSNADEVSYMYPQGRREHISNVELYTTLTSEECLTLTLYKPYSRGKWSLKLYLIV
jgi:hypothetical protein